LIGVEQAVVEGFDLDDDQGKGQVVLTARVRPRKRAKPRCSQCRAVCPGYDQGGGQRRWRGLDLGEVVVYLIAVMARVNCPEHGVVVAKVSWAHPGSRFTAAFEDSIAWMSANMPASAVAALMRVTWRSVDAIITRFFDALGPDRAAKLELVSADGAGTADGWVALVVRQRAPQAVRCMDPYHVVAWAGEAIDEVRRSTVRALAASGDTAGLELVKGSRWALLKNPGTLTGAQDDILAGIKDANTGLYTAYLLKEQLRAVFNPPAGIGARSLLAGWLSMADAAGLPAFDAVAAKVRRALPEIRNTLDHHMSSARAEANNTTVRMLTRRGFGYHSAEALIAITMLKRSGLCPDLPGRRPRHASPSQTAQAA
jgi:transposase